jgi:hypothetical protein
MPALFDTMFINLTQCAGDYAPGQVVSSSELKGGYTKDCGLQGSVTATWDLLTCVAGQACATGVDCELGLTACAGGVESCTPAGPAPDGTACGPGGALVCSGGACIPR